MCAAMNTASFMLAKTNGDEYDKTKRTNEKQNTRNR